MLALVAIGFLAFAVCMAFLIWSATKMKTKRYLAIGIGVSVILFLVGCVTPKTAQKPQASIQWTEGNSYTLDVTNTGSNIWYGFKIVVSSASDNYTNPYLEQGLTFPPGRVIEMYAGDLVDKDGKYIGTSGIWYPGEYAISMTTRLTPDGEYQDITLANGSSNIIEVNDHLRATVVECPGGATLMVVINSGDDTWYGFEVAVTLGQSNYTNVSVNRDVQVAPGQSITFLNGDLVDQFGNLLLSSTLIAVGSNPMPSMSARTSPGGPYQELTVS
jgi:hypothetical protein